MFRRGPGRGKLKNHATLSAEIADRLCRQIRRKRLAPGARLGTEAELADQYGVSRTVIREAIGHLRGLGVVTSRQGLGLSVASTDVIGTLEKVLAPVLASGQHFHELCKLRFIFEVGALPLAVERATPEQVGRMRQLADDMVALVRKRSLLPPELDTAINGKEIAFHQLIFEAAGSEFADRFHELLLQFFQETGYTTLYNTAPHIKAMQQHVQLVEAIADRDSGRALQVLIEHLRYYLDVEGP